MQGALPPPSAASGLRTPPLLRRASPEATFGRLLLRRKLPYDSQGRFGLLPSAGLTALRGARRFVGTAYAQGPGPIRALLALAIGRLFGALRAIAVASAARMRPWLLGTVVPSRLRPISGPSAPRAARIGTGRSPVRGRRRTCWGVYSVGPEP